jgi:hypothetical protein
MSFRPSSLPVRVATLMLALFIASSGTLASVAEGVSERPAAPAHVESQDAKHEGRAHPEDCALCLHLASVLRPITQPRGVLEPPAPRVAAASTRLLIQRALSSDEHPRPPPGPANLA